MNFAYPEVDNVFQTGNGKIPVLIAENRKLFCDIVTDIYNQTAGLDGKSVLSENNKIISFSKTVDLTTSFIPFELNRKNLISKIMGRIEEISLREDNFEKTANLIQQLEIYLGELSVDFPCGLDYNKINVGSILKGIGVSINDESISLSEKFLNYMDMVCEFDCDKLFITVNMRNFISDDETELFMHTALLKGFKLFMIESVSYKPNEYEARYTVDEDLCGF